MKDETLALLREGYAFLPRRVPARGWTEMRIAGLPAVAIGGDDAPEIFYSPGRFTRAGAMPPSTLRLLQDKDSVQTLDGPDHRRRKGQFLSMMTAEAVGEIATRFEDAWRTEIGGWPQGRPFVLLRRAERLLCEAACAWAGTPVTGSDAARRTREFSAMVRHAGSTGPRLAVALLLRERNERWARRLIRENRENQTQASRTPITEIAGWTDGSGALLPVRVAAVELVNLLRPTVAVARFIVFAAIALHRRPGWRARLQSADDTLLEAFAQEVRRFFPFFPAIAGRVLEPFEWRGRRFAAGEWVLTDLYGANHDPARWSAPDRFDPERFLGAENADRITAQGAGEPERGHRCPGERLTIELIKTALRLLASLPYEVPRQDLRFRINHLPTAPESGFVMRLRGPLEGPSQSWSASPPANRDQRFD